MLIYFIFFAILFAAYFLLFKAGFVKTEKTSKILFAIIFGVSFFLLLALRHPDMGVDLKDNIFTGKKGYCTMFELIGRMSWKDVFTEQVAHYERGYIIFYKIVSLISKDRQAIIIACALINAVCTSIFIYKTSKQSFFATIIYLALPSFLILLSGLRQGVAIGITMLAFLCIKEKKWLGFILLVLLASTIHASSIIFLVAYPLFYIKQTGIVKLISIAVLPVVYIFRTPLFNLLSGIFKEDAVAQENGALTLFLVFVLIYIFLLIIGNQENKMVNGCINLFFMACICQAFGGIYMTAMRVGYYFMIYACIAIPNAIADEDGGTLRLSSRQKLAVKFVIFAAFLAFGLYTLYSAQKDVTWYETNPYRFFWQ